MRLKDTIKRLEKISEENMTKKLWVRLALCYYTLGISYHQTRDPSTAKTELGKAYDLIQDKAEGGISDNVVKHIENILKFGIYRT